MRIPFVKMHGAANDFVVIDHREPFLPADRAALFARMCDRRRGVGADGVLLLERGTGLDFAMRYCNSDGRPADFCGNGARCLARFALDRGLGKDGTVRFASGAGVQEARRTADGRAIELHFGPVGAAGALEEVAAAGESFSGRLVVAGVPHFVVGVADVELVPLAGHGPALRWHPRFAPAGANVDFVATLGAARLAMRTWERGVEGETPACGSGAIASALWAAAAGERSPITVVTAGGDALVVSFARDGGGWDVRLTGPAEVAFSGEWTGCAPEPAARGG